ncbi:hypothetical protein CBW65_13900 [Tumebacillus avium]|uniref:N-acetyltransferase domain-containing protein n=1 Tax=Tumebacillus avium TaxID=1903704 RepID=A0A1Y0IN20_9BACL|nr:GNAT family N-acetyltransferase [Tumebacillus avium]ARU61972.1 hypothetical protein CBW65_13900 [Tumebacillus avium]
MKKRQQKQANSPRASAKSPKTAKHAKRTTKPAAPSTAPATTPSLTFRPRTDSDDSFISSVTLLTLKDVFEASTSQPLTEQIILHLVNQTDTCVIIEQRGKPIGYYCYDRTSSDRIYWGSLVIMPGKQARGHGKQVVEHFVAEAKKQGVRRIDGHVQVKNEDAYHFWMGNGFQVAGREQNGSVPIQLQLD